MPKKLFKKRCHIYIKIVISYIIAMVMKEIMSYANVWMSRQKKTKIVFEKFNFDLFKKIFLYYWFFSIVGHYGELVYSELLHIILNKPIGGHIISTLTPAASPYGLGAIAVLLIIWPLVKSHRIGPVGTFIASIFLTGVVEYICAVIVIIFAGYNPFWSYSDKFLNFNGQVCLESATIFGISATFAVYFVFPFTEKIYQAIAKNLLNILFWLLIASYTADAIYTYVRVFVFKQPA